MSETVERDYRDTLNIPKTAFPMKAELPKREPDARRVVAGAAHLRAPARAQSSRTARGFCTTGRRMPTAICTWGTSSNMVLKDMFVKIALLDGK